MVFDGDDNIEVAGRPTFGPGVSFAAHLESDARFYPGRDFQGKGLLSAGQAGTSTVFTGVTYPLALAVAVGAGARHGKEPLLKAHLTVAGTGLASFGAGAWPGSGTVAGCACLMARNLYLGVETESGFFKADRQIVAQIITATAAATAAAATTTEDVSEDIAEDILERSASKAA
jgi:hypothetical protein